VRAAREVVGADVGSSAGPVISLVAATVVRAVFTMVCAGHPMSRTGPVMLRYRALDERAADATRPAAARAARAPLRAGASLVRGDHERDGGAVDRLRWVLNPSAELSKP
jgi:hypothetical protein